MFRSSSQESTLFRTSHLCENAFIGFKLLNSLSSQLYIRVDCSRKVPNHSRDLITVLQTLEKIYCDTTDSLSIALYKSFYRPQTLLMITYLVKRGYLTCLTLRACLLMKNNGYYKIYSTFILFYRFSWDCIKQMSLFPSASITGLHQEYLTN